MYGSVAVSVVVSEFSDSAISSGYVYIGASVLLSELDANTASTTNVLVGANSPVAEVGDTSTSYGVVTAITGIVVNGNVVEAADMVYAYANVSIPGYAIPALPAELTIRFKNPKYNITFTQR